MEDTPSPPPSSSPSPQPSPESSSSPRNQGKKRCWRRRLRIAALLIIAVVVLLRLVIVIALPPVMRGVAARYDLNVGYDRMHLYLLSGDVGFWNLSAAPKSGGERLFTGEYVRANASALNLLRGRLVVWRAEVDGSELLVERNEDGTIPALQKFATAEPKPPSESTSQTSAIDLAPPLRIDALRLSAARAHVIDRSVKPPMDAQLELTLRLSDLGHPSKPTRLRIDLGFDPILDSLRVEGTGNSRNHALDATFRVVMRGLHPPAAAPYLAQLGLRPGGDTVNLTMDGSISAGPVNPPDPNAGSAQPPSPMKGSMKLENILAVVDGKLAAGLKEMLIEVDEVDERHAKIGKVLVSAAGASAQRTPQGALRAFGFELAPELATPAKPAAADAPTTAPSRPFKWELAQLDVSSVRFTFRDNAVSPAVDLAVALDHFTVKDLVDDPTRRDVPATIAGEITVPGIARAAKIHGTARPFAADKSAEITLAAEGIKPDALRPYLDALGIESQLKDAAVACTIRGSGRVEPGGQFVGAADITNVQVKDAGGDLLAFNGVKVEGLALDPAANRVRVETIELSGPQLAARREQSGAVAALGMRIRPMAKAKAPTTQRVASAKPQSAEPAPTPTPATQPAGVPLKLEIGRFAWKDIKVRLEDQSVAPPTAVELTDAGVELANIAINTDPAAAPTTQPGTFKAWLTAPGSVGGVVASGTIAPRRGAVSLDANVNGSKMNLAVLAPYLKPLGIEPTLTDGTLELHATADVAATDAGMTATAAIDKLRYLEGSEELAGIDALKVTDLKLGDEIEVAAVEVTKPRATVARDADGSFVAGGVRIRLPMPPSEEKPPTIATVRSLKVNDSAIRWIDRAVQPPVDTTARASVQLDNLVVGKPSAEQAKLQLAAALEGVVDSAEVDGTLSLAPKDLQAHLTINAQGVKEGSLASYLPPGTRVTLKDGQFRTKLDAVVREIDQGGQSAHVDVTGLDYRDGEASLLRFDSAKLAVDRLDLPRALTIDEISLAGFETSATLGADGTTRLLGLALAKTAEAAETPATRPAQPQAAAEVASAPTSQPAAAPTGAGDVARAAAEAKKELPDITLRKLDINLKRIALIDEAAAAKGAAPLALADWKISNPKPIEMLGKDPAARPPIELDLTGKVDPVIDTVAIGIVTTPFAQQPSLTVDVNATGIKGEGVVALAPEMKEQIDGSGMTAGTFTAHVETTLKLDRRSLADFALVKGFDATLLVKDVAFRAQPDGPILAGVEEVRSEGIRAEPAAGIYRAKGIEITKPIGHAYRDKDGVHAMGLVLKLPEKPEGETKPTEEEKKPEAVVAADKQEPTATPPATQPVQGEIRIDRLLISGVDASVEDRSLQPPVKVPITGLDVEVRDFTTRALVEDRPIRFTAIVNSGKVSVPRSDKKEEYVDRELFSQIVASGKLSLYPQPRGWVKNAVNGFELGSMQGLAKEYGVDLYGGVFDSNVELRFKGDGNIDTKSRLIFTDLQLAEPPNGPIQKFLKLSTPLDAVIVALQDPSGGITLPLNVPIRQGEPQGIAGAAVGAVGSVIVTAVASSPIKAAQSVGGLLGMERKKESRDAEPPIVLAFSPADTGLSAEAKAQLRTLVARMERDDDLQVTVKHELGAADVERARVLVNPSPQAAAALAGQLRERKNELLALRTQLAVDARVQLASHAQAAPTIARLRGVSREVAANEEALDRLYDLLRPGADRQAERRTRAACIDIGQARLDAVESLLKSSSEIEAAKDRVQITRAQFAEDATRADGRVLMTVRKVKR